MRYLKVILLLALMGCSSTLYFTEYDQPVFEDDEFSKQYEVVSVSEKQNADGWGLGGVGYNYFLRSFISKDSDTELHQLYVETVYSGGDWNYFYRATLQGGDELEIERIASDVGCSGYGCVYEETLGITIPDSLIKDSVDSFQVKAFAKSGESIVIEVSERQVLSQMTTINKNIN